ncbi:MAG: TonB-dependent receptor [Bacteroidales bacterium]|nr:TonB-dependent receptor [Candidatus Liminaster caballi]
MKKSLLVFVLSVVATVVAMAQVTTASISGLVTDENNEELIGATIVVTHVPTGSVSGAITNANGRYSVSGLRAGGPYTVKISYVGYQSISYSGIDLPLGENYVQNAKLGNDASVLEDVVVVGSSNSNMRSDRAGAGMRISAGKISAVPTVSRSMNDVMKMTPQGGNTGNGFAVGGGNYRQSFVTVDGAAFNNAFGIGANLPGNGSPISLDALDQISVNITPFDVRQSGFTGGAINAVTKSGTNEIEASAYIYQTNVHLRGNEIGDVKLDRSQSHSTTYGFTLGAPIIKNKLFIFLNGELENNISAGPTAVARKSDSDEWKTSGPVHQPTEGFMTEVTDYLTSKYGYNPGKYQGYSLETPGYRLLARIDYIINDNHKLSLRYSNTHSKDSNPPSSSCNPMSDAKIYDGGRNAAGRQSNYALYFINSRYYQERNFISWAGELNSKFGNVRNTLRATYSHQDEPRSHEGSVFPTVDVLDGNGHCLVSFGMDPFTLGNLRDVKTVQITDEATWSLGKNNFLAGVSYESNAAQNGYAQFANGYFVYNSWDDFKNGATPKAYGVTYPFAGADKDQFIAEMTYRQFSYYLQDEINLTKNFKLTAGVRFEHSIYPPLENNYNELFAKCTWADGNKYATDQVPDTKMSISPRVGFNWDMTGDRKYVLRGGTGLFYGRLPYVWLVSAVGNANVGQTQYYGYASEGTTMPTFDPSMPKQVASISDLPAAKQLMPSGATVLDKDLKMPGAWKTSLAFDAKLPGDVNFTLEGIFNKEINPAIVKDLGLKKDDETVKIMGVDGTTVIDERAHFTKIKQNDLDGKAYSAYKITNAGGSAYYYSLSAQLSKTFNFGLDLSASYTFSRSKAYSDGIGDQVSGAYYTNRYSRNGLNDNETGYGTYVSPHRVLVSVGYGKEYGKHFGSHVSFIYEGMNMGYNGSYAYTGYSYTLGTNLSGDNSGNYNLLNIPASRAELDNWNFADSKLGTEVYTADQQRDDFWAYINQDDYLKNHKGEYAERGGAMMPWHHQLDFKFNQDFFVKVGGKKNTIQLGVDIKNVLNLMNSEWGLYKQVSKTQLVKYDTKTGAYTFTTNGNERLTETYADYANWASTYSIQFSLRYIFH